MTRSMHMLAHEYVFNQVEVQERIGNKAADRKKAEKIFDSIAANYQKKYIKRASAFLNVLFGKLYFGLEFHLSSDLDFPQFVKDNNVILVPNHQSHADYLILNYILFKKYQVSPMIAGGINLNIFPIGHIFRNSGCFFIRRTFQKDILYKVVLEAYIKFLLTLEHPIEFFFEGGRSRSGKLLPPKYGLFQMIIEAHNHLAKEGHNRPLRFIPISINHEQIPEMGSMVSELKGAAKKEESTFQLLKTLKLVTKKFGYVHVKLGKPLELNSLTDLKATTQGLAFECFREVGRGMTVNPNSLLSLILLDSPAGAMTFGEILTIGRSIINHCRKYQIPFAELLNEQNIEASLKDNLDNFIRLDKVKIFQKNTLGKVFYTPRKKARLELLFYKNTILHHFLPHFFINEVWLNIFNEKIQTVRDLKKTLLEQLYRLKFEFYLPKTQDLFTQTFKIISDISGRPIHDLNDCLKLAHEDMYQVAKEVGTYASSFRYIYEAYYVALGTLKHFAEGTFTRDDFFKSSREVYEMEAEYGRFIKFPESYSRPLMVSSFKYFQYSGVITQEKKMGIFKISSMKNIDEKIDHYATHIDELLNFNLKVHTSKSVKVWPIK